MLEHPKTRPNIPSPFCVCFRILPAYFLRFAPVQSRPHGRQLFALVRHICTSLPVAPPAGYDCPQFGQRLPLIADRTVTEVPLAGLSF